MLCNKPTEAISTEAIVVHIAMIIMTVQLYTFWRLTLFYFDLLNRQFMLVATDFSKWRNEFVTLDKYRHKSGMIGTLPITNHLKLIIDKLAARRMD